MTIYTQVVFGWKEPRTSDILSIDWLIRYDMHMYFEHLYGASKGSNPVYGVPGCLDSKTGVFKISEDTRQTVIRAHAAYCSEFDCSSLPLNIITTMSGDINQHMLSEYGEKDDDEEEL